MGISCSVRFPVFSSSVIRKDTKCIIVGVSSLGGGGGRRERGGTRWRYEGETEGVRGGGGGGSKMGIWGEEREGLG